MTDHDNETGKEPEGRTTKKKKPLWRRIMTVCAWAAGSIVGLILLLMCLAAWILTPERLTPLVNKYASQYLKADVEAGRVELTVWSSFPHIRLDVTDLHLTSRTLQGQPDTVLRALGPDAAQLLEAKSVSGSINPWRLLGGTIALGDINGDGLRLNLVTYAEGVNNYDIMPESEEEEEDGSPWELRFGDIDIQAQGGIRYFDAGSGLDALLASPALHVSPRDKECKRLSTKLSGHLTLKMDGEAYINAWPTECSGDVVWDLNTLDIDLPAYKLGLGIFGAELKAAMSLGEAMVLKACSLKADPVNVALLLKALPAEMCDEYPMLKQLDTDMQIKISADVACPWRFDAPDLPDVNVGITVPPCHIALNDGKGRTLLALHSVALDAEMFYNGKQPENSKLDIPLFNIAGKGVKLDMSAFVQEMLGDNPLIGFSSEGELDLGTFSALIPYSASTLKGLVKADASITCRLEDMMALRYENIEANGSLLIRDLVCEIPTLATRIYSRMANFAFGNALTDMGPRVPGTLMAHADVDTLFCAVPGIDLGMRDIRLKAGASDALLREQANDKVITPMGMSISARNLRMDSKADTTKVRASSLTAEGSITRYEGNATSPLLKASLNADKMLYADPTMRLGLKAFSSDLIAHLRPRKHKGKRRKHSGTRTGNPYTMKLEMDDGVKQLFKTWGISGNLASGKARLTHLLYPVPVNITGLDFDFSLDSVLLHHARIRTQNTSLSLSGSLANIRHLMLGRTRKPLVVRLNADIDSIDLNQITYNYLVGAALESQRGRLARLSEEEQDAIVRAAAAVDTVQSLASDSIPLILPRNIDARVGIRAGKALYGDINLYKLRTDFIVNDGAASVDSLMASTDFGNAYLNLLYSSRNPQLLNLAIDLGFSEIDLQKFYSTFPAVLEMAPSLSDLSGLVGTKLVGSFDMYPNMDIDFNSMNAMLNITGTNLELNQSPLIRKVARMMLIRKKGPLQITDMNIQVSLHDNVVRLYPFKFGMEKYRFALLGQNDMASNMFYHLSVLKSPIPFKFGINVKGTFDKPKLRFGGAKYKDNEAQEMVDLIETQRVNFVKAMRLELRKLIRKAAVTYADRPELSKYGIDKELDKAKGTQHDNDKDDSGFNSPIEMLGASLKAPTIKALGGAGDAIQEFAKKYLPNENAEDGNKSGKKKGKKK